MADNIRKQFTPIRARLSSRLQEAQGALHDTDVMRLRRLRTKLMANMETHERLYTKINELTGVSTTCQRLLDEEIEVSTELSMDANEAYQALSERIEELRTNEDTALLHTKMREDEKMEREIEKLKVETEYKRTQLGKLKDEGEGTTSAGGTCGGRGCAKGSSVVGGGGGGRVAAPARHSNLPLLTLPSFCGKITEWPSYWHTFSSLIHFNEELSKVDKFKYLLSSLEGEARRSLLGFRMVDEEYEQAIEHIKDTYDGKEYIIHDHYAALSKMPRCSNKTSDLRQTFNFIETQIRSLQCVGENVENNYLVALIKSKLPEQFSKKLTGVWTLELLRKSISKIILARELQEEGPSYNTEHLHTTDHTRSPPGGPQEFKMKRIFCGKSHWSEECRHVGTTTEGKVEGEKRCFICLSNKHLFQENEVRRVNKEARSPQPMNVVERMKSSVCAYCKTTNDNHVSICPNNRQIITEKEYSTPTADDPKTKASAHQIKRTPKEPTKTKLVVERTEDNALAIDEDVVVTLPSGALTKTAKTTMENLKTGVSEGVRIVVDTSSQHTFVTRDLVKRLGLEVEEVGVKEEEVEDEDKDTDTGERRVLCRTRFAIKEKDGSRKTLRANVCKSISLKRRPSTHEVMDIKKYKHIWKNLVMADDLPNDLNTATTSSTTTSDVICDVIIGNDYYDEIIRSEKIEIEAGVFLVSSSLGWMFSGGRSKDKNSSPMKEATVVSIEEQNQLPDGVVEVTLHPDDVNKFARGTKQSRENGRQIIQQQQLQQHHQEQQQQQHHHQEQHKLEADQRETRSPVTGLVNEKNKLNDILLKKEKIMDDLIHCEKEKERLNDKLHSTRVDMHKVIEALHGHKEEEEEDNNIEEEEIICIDRVIEFKAMN